jgi:hypothetical protein
MRITAPKGTKVVFLFVEAEDDREDTRKANRFLQVGKVYTVKETYPGNFTSTVEFEEFPGTRFNTILFAEVLQQ